MKKLLALILIPAFLLASEYVLATQWYPSVCKVKRYRACKNMLPFWRENLTLHGLWPKNKEYCGVPARWKILDKKGAWNKIPLKLPSQIEQLLLLYMPGSISGLHKHEWVKHGSCTGKSPQHYFLASISLVSQINGSKVRDFFLKNRGKRVQTYKIRQIFDKEFGKGAGKRVKFVCKKGYLTELRLNLKGVLSTQSSLAELLKKARKTRLGCKRGMIAR